MEERAGPSRSPGGAGCRHAPTPAPRHPRPAPPRRRLPARPRPRRRGPPRPATTPRPDPGAPRRQPRSAPRRRADRPARRAATPQPPTTRPLRSALAADRPENRWQRHTMAALFRDAPSLMSAAPRRARHQAGAGAAASATRSTRPSRADLLALLRPQPGLPSPAPKPPGPPPRHSLPTEPVHVLLGVGRAEPRPDRPAAARGGAPPAWSGSSRASPCVGPFVAARASRPACAASTPALSEDDPAWPLLVEQYARLTGRGDRADGVPEPVDAALAALAVAWAAREVATYAEGGTPSTLGTTVRLSARSSEDRDPALGPPSPVRLHLGRRGRASDRPDSAPIGLNVVQHLPTRGAEWLSWPTSHAKPSRARPAWPVSPSGTPDAPPSAWASGWAAPRPRPS